MLVEAVLIDVNKLIPGFGQGWQVDRCQDSQHPQSNDYHQPSGKDLCGQLPLCLSNLPSHPDLIQVLEQVI